MVDDAVDARDCAGDAVADVSSDACDCADVGGGGGGASTATGTCTAASGGKKNELELVDGAYIAAPITAAALNGCPLDDTTTLGNAG